MPEVKKEVLNVGDKNVVNKKVLAKDPIKPKYYKADKLSLSDFRKTIPKEFIPTKKLNYIFGGIFIIVVVIGLLQFPFISMLSGNIENMSIRVGLPWSFFVFNLENPETLPIRFGGLILDLILYLIIAYAVDVALNVFMRSSLYDSFRKKKSKRPVIYKSKKIPNVNTIGNQKPIQKPITKT